MSSITKRVLRHTRFAVAIAIGAITAGFLFLAGAYLYLSPKLPSIESLKDVRLQVPLRVYTRAGSLMAEYGEKRRTPVRFAHVPEVMIKAFLAAEDDRFFSHPGVDYQGLLRAAYYLVLTGEKGQGGSTITMQVARNFFLSSEKTYLRKLNEIFLALKIEHELSKEDIMELYLNKIYLGNRAYGVQAAAQVYYGRNVHELDMAQTAMIAGLPKAPSSYNPVVNPTRALTRRDYVLGRMYALGFIDKGQYEVARQSPVSARLHKLSTEVEAPYVAEMVRAEMVRRYGNEAYTAGYRVYTTLDNRLQDIANRALRTALLEYDQRHGFHGAVRRVELDMENPQYDEWQRILREIPEVGGLRPGLVLRIGEKEASVYLGNEEITIGWDGLQWARSYINDNRRGPVPKVAADVVKPGDIIYVHSAAESVWHLAQVPEVSGALVSLLPGDGAIVALVGGFDFYQSKFNRAIQAQRQPGSSFKPFIYSAALEKGFTAASLINDAPVVFEDTTLENTWRPENYSGKVFGPTRMREALVKSRNLVSIRLLRSIGIDYAVKYISSIGLPPESLPRNLSLALGSGVITPLQLITSYAVFANGGFQVESYFIDRIETEGGELLFQHNPLVACLKCEEETVEEVNQDDGRQEAVPASDESDLSTPVIAADAGSGEGLVPGQPAALVDGEQQSMPVKLARRVLTPENHFLIYSMMRDVVKRGTGRSAMSLGRNDFAGKTGTTNDQRDAWFSGFNADLVATAWVGFDQVRPLGNRETGGRAALPAWKTFMGEALKGEPEHILEPPPGMVTVRIDPRTGLLADSNTVGAIFETFQADRVPQKKSDNGGESGDGGRTPSNVTEQIF